jgi:polysaccharide export outer membrane protein
VTNLFLAPRDLAGYVLGPNDLVAIKIYQEPDMDATVRVAKDGTIHYPPLGDLRLAGRTVQYASSVIREKLALDYLVNPQVAITVLEGMKSRFTILGEVVRPGIYDLPDEGIGLLEAIGLAGGFKPGAKRGRVVVTRMVDERKVIRTVNADALATDADAKMFSVLPDDLITVKASFF